jgi:hypothetical protein
MRKSCYSYHYRNSLLLTVPAVHHQTAFARHVHSVFRDPELLPDAVAVELGHNLVLELVHFLRELKQGMHDKIMLPCMLGIMKRNRYIDVTKTQRALLLQEFHRLPLNDLPDGILAERLNFSRWSTIYISPGDSIIEAVRCAIEMNIPVYGVDMADFASTTTRHYRIQDPYCAGNNLQKYGDHVLKYCDAGRDPRIDLNRETVMASGLKYCLSKHKKVLFTCGMAHWKSIISLLDDDQIPPYPVFEIPSESEFRRVIVHPVLAAPLMEIIPQITFGYETERQPVNLPEKKTKMVKYETAVRNCLDDVYKEYTSTEASEEFKKVDSVKWSKIDIYEQYLFQLLAIRQRKIPDFASMLDSANVMMSDNFCRLLTRKIMQVTPEWVSPKDFPELEVIDQTVHDMKGIQKIISGDINKYWKWSQTGKQVIKEYHLGNPWVWPPCESLIYGIAFKAAEISNLKNKKIHDSTAFNGSLEGGIDIKATIRSVIRGEKNIYISKLASGIDQSILDGNNPDPFVLIFPETSDPSLANWAFFTAGSDLGHSVKDHELFERIRAEQGSVFVSSVLMEEKIAPPPHLRSLTYEMSKTIGTVMFGNPCINAKQSAIWLETSGYKCCPVLSDYGMPTLIKYYSDRFNLVFDLSDWEQSLIRMAIPFAKKMITIVAPDSFQISDLVKTEASGKRVFLNSVSLSNFSNSQLEEAQHRFSIHTLDSSGMDFPPETEAILGQTKETYFEMLPYAIRKQVGYTENMNE